MNRQKKQLLNKTYQQFMEIALSSNNISGLKNIVDPNVTGIGTAKDEKMFTLSDLRELLKRQKKQSKGVKLSWKTKLLSRHIGADENSAVYVDDLTLNIVTGSETIKMYIRFSVVLEYRNEKWLVVHWHGSKPENVQSEEDTYGIENWKKKSEELEKLVKERTGELMVKNRELEIESSLERVRSVAMGMKKPEDMLDVCKTIAQQLELLHVKEIRNVQTAIIFSDKGTYLNYEYYAKYNKLIATEVSYINHSMSRAFVKKMLDGPNEFFKRSLTKKKTQEWYAFQKKSTNQFADKFLITASSLNYYWYSLGPVALGISTYKALSKNEQELFVRFRNVFELSYRRFLDIQKAEAQAREAQIEAALERVRSRAMAMHTSKELKEVAREMRNQFSLLGQKELETCAIHLWDESSETFEAWAALRSTDNTGEIIESESKLKIKGVRTLEESYQQYLACKKDYVLVNDVARAKEFFNALKPVDPKAYTFLSNTIKNKKSSDISAYWSVSDFPGGSLVMVTYNQPDDNSRTLLRRFANVFGLAYQRFNDLKKAEAQARESQIQLALERVRARTMAMQKSDELSETVYILFQQFRELGENPDQATIGIINEKDWVIEYWVTMYGNQMDKVFKFSIDEPNVTNKIYEAWKENKKSLVIDLSGKELLEFMSYRAGKGGAAVNLNEKRRIINVAFFSKGLLIVQSIKEQSEESIKLLERFAAVFEQTYTRFLDLQKAEAQVREAQIETSLERVRSRSMAMHKSDELKEVIRLVLEQFVHLKINAEHAGFYIDYKAQDDMHIWLADPNLEPFFAIIPYFDTPTWNSFLEAKAMGTAFHTDLLDFEEKNKFYNSLFKLFTIPEEAKEFYLQCKGLAVSTVLLDNVGLYIENFSGIPYRDEENQILIRFGKVFQQTYTRFLDLQKAEAQTRESQIQLALERVRARTMAMQKSDELLPTADILFDQLKQLGAELQGVAFAICDKNSAMVQKWTSIGNFSHPYNIEPGEQRMYEAWKNQTGMYEEVYEGEKQKKYYELFMKIPEFRKGLQKFIDMGFPIPTWQKNYAVPFQHGYLLFIITKPFNETQIFLRFGKVFEQTYTRFLDLQKAEAQAREAQIEAALEKVRSRTLAMQKSDELAETSAVLFQQLIHLGISPNRLYIGIMKDDAGETEFWITDEDGSKVSMAYHDNLNNNPSFKKMYDGWKQQTHLPDRQEKSLVIDMKDEELQEYLNYLSSIHVPFKGGLSQKRRVQYLAYFSKGFIGMASPEPQPTETLQLLERFAYVFNLTFTRFNDLQIAEAHALQAEQDLIAIKAARKKAEETLTELQATQKQLIQSEKMASLGELTAGIAHEIQNPLNFVNNFSEVSNELIDEINEELQKGDIEEAKAIAADVKQNLEKINLHGKRAADIVKGMLQHSRKSEGKKEPTDINALADEYLRLSYHGLRAKDKSFNAEMKTDFDSSIGKINIIPQDIGRVLLNLYNNAFYAVNAKANLEGFKNLQGLKYEPTVSVSTSLNPPLEGREAITITVSDNGPGIPQKIIDKIFQPFFTTKPTGSGTGLGLSLSYDIVKAHGGEIKVESKEGEGAIFIIMLPTG